MPTASRTAAIRPGARPGGAGVRQRGLGVVVEQFACGDQMARDEVGRGAIQSGEFAADLRRQLLGFDVRRDRRTARRRGAVAPRVWAGRGGRDRARDAAPRRSLRRRSPPAWTAARASLVTAALPVLRPRMPFYTSCQIPAIRDGKWLIQNSKSIREYRITPHAIVGGDSNVCSAVSYFSTRVG